MTKEPLSPKLNLSASMANKGLAIIAVVAIHIGSRFIQSPVVLFVDQLSRFCVPLFIALSGFGLTKSFSRHLDQAGSPPLGLTKTIAEYYLRRVWKILPWFIFASGVIMVFRNWWENAGFDLLNLRTWASAMTGGAADYHLYFVPMIFKFYLIFPLLFFAEKSFQKQPFSSP
jgi:peptidoglycan/LPS O-acetylase OafA/YrhL